MNKCKTCNNGHDGSYGSGKYCSRSCANSRGPRSEETKNKIREKNLLRASERGPEWNQMMKEVNSDPARIARKKATWKAKRNWETATPAIKKKWVREEVGKCERCDISKWNGEHLTLEIHHIDGDKYNNV